MNRFFSKTNQAYRLNDTGLTKEPYAFHNLAVPSEPRKQKLPHHNPFVNRPSKGLGATSQYRAERTALNSLTESSGQPGQTREWAIQTICEWLEPSAKFARLQRYR